MKNFYVTYAIHKSATTHPVIRSIEMEDVNASGLSEGKLVQMLEAKLREYFGVDYLFILNYWEI